MKLSVTKSESIDSNIYVISIDGKQIWVDSNVKAPVALGTIDDLVSLVLGCECDAQNSSLLLGEKRIKIEMEIPVNKSPSAEEVFDFYREVLIAAAKAIAAAKVESSFEGDFDLP